MRFSVPSGEKKSKKRSRWRRFMLRPFGRWLHRIGYWMPKGLFARSLIIIIMPMVLLQSVIGYVFMERHWQTTTQRLSSAVTASVAALIDIYESYPQDKEHKNLIRIANDRLNLDVEILTDEKLPLPAPKPFFSILDETLSEEIDEQISRPFWIDTVGRSSIIEVRIQLDNNVMRVFMRRSQAYASNSHIFLVWMLGSSLVLIGVAILFLRNQIRPIQKLAFAAEAFGKGRDVSFRPQGAREVRQAGQSFIGMKQRIERSLAQRTTMLNGVSHDLRTILTRFKLSLEFLPDNKDTDDLKRDVDEMTRMLEAYLAFAKGDDAGEQTTWISIKETLEQLKEDTGRHGKNISIICPQNLSIPVRPDSFRRLLYNLTTNAIRHGEKVELTVLHDNNWLTIHIDDDGPGVPEKDREYIFKPFVRLDESRNQDESSSGLGLSIARDLARAHGGDIFMGDSPLGGLRATIRIPV